MTGMKEGAGEDPFAESAESDADEGNSRDERDRSTESGGQSSEDVVGSPAGSGQQSVQIPYKFRRDSVQDDRERVPLFLMEDTKAAERDGLRELEERFNDDVSLTDLREAVVAVGLQHLDEVEGQLEEWGYGMTFGSE